MQAQILAFTYASNSTRLQNVTNAFGFIGLTLDIIGTTFGVVDAVLLQKSIRRSQSLQDPQHISSLKETVQNFMTTDFTADAERSAARYYILKLLQMQMEERKAFWTSRHAHVIPFDQPFSQHRAQLIREESANTIMPVRILQRIASKIRTSFPTFSTPFEIYPLLLPALQLVPALTILTSVFSPDSSTVHLGVKLPLGKIPLAVMILGIGCLMVSVICFAINSQPRAIWTACVAVTSITIFYSSIGAWFMLVIRGNENRDDKGDLYRRLDAASWMQRRLQNA